MVMVMVEKLFLAPTGALGDPVRAGIYAQKSSDGVAEVSGGS